MQRGWKKTLWLGFIALLCLLDGQERGFVSAQRNGQPKRGQKAPAPPSAKVRAENLYALVIGISDYNNGWRKLRGVKEDLVVVRPLLEQLGFHVTTVQNPDKQGLLNGITQFIDNYGYDADNRLLIYFAGHGATIPDINDNDMGYIVSVDAPTPDADRVGFWRKAVSMDDISGFAKKMQCRHALFIFDSCFSGAIFDLRGEAAPARMPPSIESKMSRVVRQFITSGTKNQTVPDESIFRRYLQRAFEQREADANNDGYITGTELGDYLSERVERESQKTQTPQHAKLNNVNYNQGDFVFKLPTVPETAPVTPPAVKLTLPSAAELEKETYEDARASNEPEVMREFIREYPKSVYVSRLRVAISKIETERKREQERLTALAKENVKPPLESVLPPAPVQLPVLSHRTAQLILTHPSRFSAPNLLLVRPGADALPPPLVLPALSGRKASLAVVRPTLLSVPGFVFVMDRSDAPPPVKQLPTVQASKTAPVTLPPITLPSSPGNIALSDPSAPPPKLSERERIVNATPTPSAPPPAAVPSAVRLTPNPLAFETATVSAKGKVEKKFARSANVVMIEIAPGITMEFVEIPAGTFVMGSPDNEAGRASTEGPTHTVNVSSFWMGRYEVTQAQWQAVAVALPKSAFDLSPNPSLFKGDSLPVENISWLEAIEFCVRLAQKTGLKFRLPFEAEWEYACRAGATTPFSFGAAITDALVNYDGTQSLGNAPKGKYRKSTVPVGTLGYANAFGLSDMHGNVWEWCLDNWRENYRGASDEPATLMDDRPDRVIRGGSWFSPALECRAAQRKSRSWDLHARDVGFRVVMEPIR